jgi:flagellin
VLTQGIQYANDGLSQLQIADGGLNDISQLLDWARTLATQSASGTFTGDRGVLEQEFQSVISEIDPQEQSIGLYSGGQFGQNLTVFSAGGKPQTGFRAIQNGSVLLDLSQATGEHHEPRSDGRTVDQRCETDIGPKSAT